MAVDRVAGATVAPLERWTPVHPAALAVAGGTLAFPAEAGQALPRSSALGEALAAANRAWGNPVDGELARWRAGAEVVVTGQQPGLLGGPLLTLVKAAAVAAEVHRRRAAGRDAVGFLWLATADDDLAEVGWGRVVVGEEVREVREPGWERGGLLVGDARLGESCTAFLDAVRSQLPGGHAAEAVALAGECYRPGARLGDATARFLARLLSGTGIVLVDALEPELARSAAPVLARVLAGLPAFWEALAAGTEGMRARGWRPPLRISPQKLPAFRRVGERREGVPTKARSCPPEVVREAADHPERFLPNAWLRPLVQDAALGTAAAVLGGAELAYHVQTAEVRPLAGIPRPDWLLRPHVTVVTSTERRLAKQLGVTPEHLLRPTAPSAALPGRATRRRLERARAAIAGQMEGLAHSARQELPSLAGEVDATSRKLDAALAWLEGRMASAASRDADVELSRWRRLRAFLRPDGSPQERRLSVLAPLVRLGTGWPAQLVAALDPADPGMHLLFWGEGGAW